MTLLTRHKTKDSPYFQMKIIILIALQGVKFPEGGAAAPVAPPLDMPLNLVKFTLFAMVNLIIHETSQIREIATPLFKIQVQQTTVPNLKVREYMVFSIIKDQKLKKVRAVLSSSFTSNYRRAISQEFMWSDFDPIFFYLFVYSSSVTYVKTEMASDIIYYMVVLNMKN